jgi:2-polyprenyl-6-methoxyphenol hydroxylase-like FAD-dependent oxidoreductase
MNMESLSSSVVVVGAGPVGLWLACELQLAGVPTLVLEREVERSPHSKALGIHARTIEVLAMRGLASQVIDAGVRVPSWHFGMLESRMDFQELDTPFPYMLALPQVRTEELFEKRALDLGARILRGRAVTAVTQDESSVSVTLDDGDVVRADYVVGCDGAGSTVRKSAGIAFPGTDATTWAYLGDVHLDAPPQGPYGRYTTDGALIVAPIPGGRYRVTGVDPAQQNNAPLTLADLRASTIRVAGTDFGMRDPAWLSKFSSASRQAASYRAGRILLAGDAAHMHMPAGGVGLNVGVQDAMNLGWKLAAVAQSRAPQHLLDTYHTERHPVGVDLLEHTNAQTALISTFTPEMAALRATFNKLIKSQPGVARELAGKLSGLDVAYAPDTHPLTGTRAPNLDGRLFSLLHNGHVVLLNCAGHPLPATAAFASTVGVEVVDMACGRPDWAGVGTALIRPDGHVWWALESHLRLDGLTRDALAGLGFRHSGG